MAVSFCKQFLMEEIPFRFETLQYEKTYKICFQLATYLAQSQSKILNGQF